MSYKAAFSLVTSVLLENIPTSSLVATYKLKIVQDVKQTFSHEMWYLPWHSSQIPLPVMGSGGGELKELPSLK